MTIKEPGNAHVVDKILRKSQLLMKIMTPDLSDDNTLSGSWVDWFTKENFKIVCLINSIDLNNYAFRSFRIYQNDTIGTIQLIAHTSINLSFVAVVNRVTQSTPKTIPTMNTGINLKTRFEFFE